MGKVAVTAAVIGGAAVCAAVALILRHRMRSSSRWARASAILKELEDKCETSSSKLKQVADAMTVEMHAGLASEGGSKLKMLISYVDNLPTGYIILIRSPCISMSVYPYDLLLRGFLINGWCLYYWYYGY